MVQARPAQRGTLSNLFSRHYKIAMNPSPKALAANARTARRIAEMIADDIGDRCGLGNEWEHIDSEVQAEILETWTRIVEGELNQ